LLSPENDGSVKYGALRIIGAKHGLEVDFGYTLVLAERHGLVVDEPPPA
jgi:hypothetical protein